MMSSTTGRRPGGDTGVEIVALSRFGGFEGSVDGDTNVSEKRVLGASFEKEDRPTGSRSSVGNDAAAASLLLVPVATI